MKKIILATAALAALAIPAVANAASLTYWDPADSTFVTTEITGNPAAQAAAAKADEQLYTTQVSYWDPVDSVFVTDKVGSQPLVGTHDAPMSRAQALNDFILRQQDN